MSRKEWNRNKFDVVNTYVYNIALNIKIDYEDLESIPARKCRDKDDWPK